MVTLELPYDPDALSRPESLPAGHLAEVHDRWKANPGAYIQAVAPAVCAMLSAACRYPR
jgi:hypothetical protein